MPLVQKLQDCEGLAVAKDMRGLAVLSRMEVHMRPIINAIQNQTRAVAEGEKILEEDLSIEYTKIFDEVVNLTRMFEGHPKGFFDWQ